MTMTSTSQMVHGLKTFQRHIMYEKRVLMLSVMSSMVEDNMTAAIPSIYHHESSFGLLLVLPHQ
jgi:hypothetical protein